MKAFLKQYLHKKYLFPLFAGFLAFLLIKLFLFDVMVVKSRAMMPLLKQGQWVLVQRVFTPQRNDIVQVSIPLAETDPAAEKMKTFKRIVGMPGDTISIINSRVYINGKMAEENREFLHNYLVKLKAQRDTMLLEEAGLTDRSLVDDSCAYLLILSDDQFDSLQARRKFTSLIANSEDPGLFDETIFPYDPGIKWNKDFFGPLYLPREGDEIVLDTTNFKAYKRIICDLEGNDVRRQGNKFMLFGGDELRTYRVKENYYFVTGDNFDNSIDSRHWGFIPESKLKARLVRRK